MAKQTVEFVLSEIAAIGLKVDGKRKELIIRNFRREKTEMGLKAAAAALQDHLAFLKGAQTNAGD